MPSLLKTAFLQLNKWAGNEYPKREDFVSDNEKIDVFASNVSSQMAQRVTQTAFSGHTSNTTNAHGIDNKLGLAGGTMLGDIRFDRPTGGILNANNNTRTALAGGSEVSVSTGAYVLCEGINFGGTGVGGAIGISTVSGKPIVFSSGASQILILIGTGSPEGVKTAPIGSLYLRTDGGANTTLYVKQSGTGNTGWVAK